MVSLAINVLLYQSVWFLCVFWGTGGAVIALLLIGGHLLTTRHRKEDLMMMGLLLVCGLIVDGIIHRIGYIEFPVPAQPIPLWLAVIWMALALMVHHSLRWLKKRPLLSMFFGALGGPLAYWAGVKAGAATFVAPLFQSLVLLAVVWGLLWPAVMHVGERMLPKETARHTGDFLTTLKTGRMGEG